MMVTAGTAVTACVCFCYCILLVFCDVDADTASHLFSSLLLLSCCIRVLVNPFRVTCPEILHVSTKAAIQGISGCCRIQQGSTCLGVIVI